MQTTDHFVEVLYLGWEKPFMHAVAEHLIEQRPDLDWNDVHLVISSARAARRLLSLLADVAANNDSVMVPPNIVTPGQLPELLYTMECLAAGPILRQMVWVSALRQVPCEVRRSLFPKLNDGSTLHTWQGAARSLEQCAEELAAGGTDFAGVVAKAGDDNRIRCVDRWEAAARVYEFYLNELQAIGVCDRQRARAEAGNTENPRRNSGRHRSRVRKIILAGVTELSRQSRLLLSQLPESVLEALVFAPLELAEGFDDFGCVLTEFWEERHVDLSSVRLRMAQGIADQAQAVFVSIMEAGENRKADEILIGVTDEQIVPHLETMAENLGDVPVRFGRGMEMATTRPFQLLRVIAAYVETGDFREFCAVVRHPDLEKWLASDDAQGTGDGEHVWRDWRTLLDTYARRFLPRQLRSSHNQPGGWRVDSDDNSVQDDRPDLAWLFRNVERLIGDLKMPLDAMEADAVLRTPDEWAPAILGVLQRAFGGLWDQRDPVHRRVVMSCRCFGDVLEELVEAGKLAGGSRFEEVPAHEAVALVLSLTAGHRIPPLLMSDEIEIAGWLELMPEDAQHLVVSGFNEGMVPKTTPPSPLINEVVRETTGLPRDRDRLARDAYLLTAMVESRKNSGGSVTLICGRRSANNDPLLPSRLMFCCEPHVFTQRTLEAVEPARNVATLATKFRVGTTSRFLIGAAGRGKDINITSMRVTAFRDYLCSPQGFYLKNVLGIDTVEGGAPRELDARQCGEIVHEVMKDFSATAAATSDSKQQCVDTLIDLLDARIDRRFGTSIPGTVKFQVEMLRRRLAEVGDVQARWFADGWRIVETEWHPARPVGLEVDGRVMGLRGRIDRIDFNERLKTFAVLDYKVGAGGRPEQTHRRSGRWRDLQLPLYRHLAKGFISVDCPRMQLGYLVVAEDPTKIGHLIAKWDDGILADADETARQVVRDVRACKFDEVGDDPPTDGIFGHIFGKGVLTNGGEDGVDDQEVGS